jgi:D-alanyl-D-alanine carboxypeptidase (penicillin-binding protein 5/6)
VSNTSPPLFSGGSRRRRGVPLVLLGGAVVIATLILVLTVFDSGSSPDEQRSASTPVDRQPSSEGAATALGTTGRSGRRRERGGDDSRFALDLSRPDLVKLRFVRRPRAGLLFDVRTGRVLWRLNPTRRLPIASLTKMMTALLVVEREDPHDRVKVTKEAVTTAGSGIGVLPKGKKVQLEALLNGLLLVSGNDAAVALSRHTAGSVPSFVRLMNRRAGELGLSCTRFSTPHGLLDRGNHSCVADLGVLARADLAKRRIRRVTRRHQAVLKFPIKGGRLFLYNNNPLIRSGYRGVTGLKTGYTRRAGRSIVATAKRGRVELGVVLLRSYSPAEQAPKLLNRGFKALRQAG